ncbi:MAG: hypothetical protein ACI9FB_003776 [Candidatus Azotimanducaceae bacterium]|jgi:hypothetical protein
MNKFDNQAVASVFEGYPVEVGCGLMCMRDLIFEVAADLDPLIDLEESLRWGEPAYLCKSGSTIRLGFKKSNPAEYGMYFNCKAQLIETIQEVYGADFQYEGQRALIFQVGQKINSAALKQCIALALRYHKLKHLPLLGL